MDEHARGTLRFIKLFTELSFTSFQVTHSWGELVWDVPSEGGAGMVGWSEDELDFKVREGWGR